MEMNGNPIERGSRPRMYKTVITLFLIFVIGICVIILARAYEKWKGMDEVRKIAEVFEEYEEDLYKKQVADTYGGQTPQETLQLYIEAVDRGDYELASKYFVEEKREAWAQELLDIKNSGKMEVFLNPIKATLSSSGDFSSDNKLYFIDDPVAINFVLYPNGIWKINEI